nr:formate dehydrogenase accessory sulfurtransferase FdhD [uncultured Psychrobacter sp.]
MSIDTNLETARALTSVSPLSRHHLTHKHYYSKTKNTKNNFDESLSAGSISAIDEFDIDSQQASLAVEAAVSIVINGIHYAVLMASPQQLEYLAVGFLFSEGLIDHSRDLLDWDVTQLTDSASFAAFSDSTQSLEHLLDYDIYVVELVLNQRCHQRIQAQKRQLAGRTGCGMCGITGLAQALPDLSAYQGSVTSHSKPSLRPELDTLLAIRAKIDMAQHTHQLTGAVHAAATVYEGQLYLFEDVGRHNALDKLIGWQLRQKADIDCVVMTSRLSIELVQKSIRMRLPWLVGMSAPTSTAVRVAERYGLGLAGFLRQDRVTYYAGYDTSK